MQTVVNNDLVILEKKNLFLLMYWQIVSVTVTLKKWNSVQMVEQGCYQVCFLVYYWVENMLL